MNPDVARSRTDMHFGPATADCAPYMVVVDIPLRNKLAVAMNAARAGPGVKRETGAPRPNLDTAGTGGDAPWTRRRAARLDVA